MLRALKPAISQLLNPVISLLLSLLISLSITMTTVCILLQEMACLTALMYCIHSTQNKLNWGSFCRHGDQSKTKQQGRESAKWSNENHIWQESVSGALFTYYCHRWWMLNKNKYLWYIQSCRLNTADKKTSVHEDWQNYNTTTWNGPSQHARAPCLRSQLWWIMNRTFKRELMCQRS